ncbi:hypothetical protein SNE40_001212 [Patella caerulea]|uniref:Inositol polyphosphate-related phosphatase domain-containing protein n=1 Tax=Patella caerulea TaxID=87958 RepID=A0AAN8KFG4_PATCE
MIEDTSTIGTMDEPITKKQPKVKKKGMAAKLAEKKRKNGSLVSLRSQSDIKTDNKGEVNGEDLKRCNNNHNSDVDVIHVSTKHNDIICVTSSSKNDDVSNVSTNSKRLTKRERYNESEDKTKDKSIIDATSSNSSSKPRPRPRRNSDNMRPKNPEPIDLDEGFNTGKSTGETDEAIVSPSETSQKSQRHRNLRLTHQRSNSVESLKNGPFMPKPPATPRSKGATKGESVIKDNISSGEEADTEAKNSPSNHRQTVIKDSHQSPRLKNIELAIDPCALQNKSAKDIDSPIADRLSNGSETEMRELAKNYEKILNDKLDTPRSAAEDKLFNHASPLQSPGHSPSKLPSPRLAPLTPLKHPPPLPGNFTSPALRTKYKTEITNQSNLFGNSDSTPHIATDNMSQKSYASVGAIPVMTTKEARSRSQSDAGILSSPSLIGAEELERYFPDRQIHVWIGSWNMKEIKSISSSMTDFLLPETIKYVQNIYVVGTQENAMNKKEWEIHIQEILGPTFVLFHSVTHGSLHLAVFIHRDLIWFCSVPEEDIISTRAVTMVKTKGAIAISLSFFGSSILFINCHLTSDQSRKKERILDYQKIISGLKLPRSSTSTSKDATANFDCVFWCGDLNFRIDRKKSAVEGKVTEIAESLIPNYEDLIRGDQLTKTITEGKIFLGFQEGRINFRPTYKYDVNSDNYDTSVKSRIPAYTDRILFRSKKKNHISCLHYDSVMSVMMSDHKPVYGIYQMAVKPGRDFVMSAAGNFDRDVYLKANQRRALRLATSEVKNQKSSTICSIQ